jgi:hypothetical protein
MKAGKRTAKEIKQFLDASYQYKPPEKIDDWVLDKQLTTKTAKVYYNPQTGEAVVAHRGTEGIKDWANNVAYVVGAYDYTPRFKKGKSVQDKAEKKYKKENISTIAHSQGSIIARKVGADTKEVINVNPAYTFEKPKKNEYNVRSSGDLVSSLYSPVAKTRKLLYPTYSKKHDITIPSQGTGIVGEHSYNVLDRLGNKEIGVGAGINISSNNIMYKQSTVSKGGRRYNRLGYNADDIDWFSGGIYPVAHANVGTNPIGVIGGVRDSDSESDSDTEIMGGKNPFKTKGSVAKKVSKAFKSVNKGFATGLEKANPFASKAFSNVGKEFGDVANNYLLPAVVSAGKPLYDATAMSASTMLTGNPVLGKAVADTLWNEMVAKQGYDPRERQKSKELGQLSETLGKSMAKPLSASLKGSGKDLVDFETIKWGTFTRMFEKFKKENPKARVKDLDAFAHRILKNKKKFSSKAIKKAQFYVNVISKIGGRRIVGQKRPYHQIHQINIDGESVGSESEDEVLEVSDSDGIHTDDDEDVANITAIYNDYDTAWNNFNNYLRQFDNPNTNVAEMEELIQQWREDFSILVDNLGNLHNNQANIMRNNLITLRNLLDSQYERFKVIRGVTGGARIKKEYSDYPKLKRNYDKLASRCSVLIDRLDNGENIGEERQEWLHDTELFLNSIEDGKHTEFVNGIYEMRHSLNSQWTNHLLKKLGKGRKGGASTRQIGLAGIMRTFGEPTTATYNVLSSIVHSADRIDKYNSFYRDLTASHDPEVEDILMAMMPTYFNQLYFHVIKNPKYFNPADPATQELADAIEREAKRQLGDDYNIRHYPKENKWGIKNPAVRNAISREENRNVSAPAPPVPVPAPALSASVPAPAPALSASAPAFKPSLSASAPAFKPAIQAQPSPLDFVTVSKKGKKGKKGK